MAQLTLQRVGEFSRQPPLEQFRQQTASYLENRPSGQIFVSTEVYSADGLPYIGPYGRRTPNLFVAAAYGGQGILGSITAAQVTPDMKYATVYFSVLGGDPKETKKGRRLRAWTS